MSPAASRFVRFAMSASIVSAASRSSDSDSRDALPCVSRNRPHHVFDFSRTRRAPGVPLRTCLPWELTYRMTVGRKSDAMLKPFVVLRRTVELRALLRTADSQRKVFEMIGRWRRTPHKSNRIRSRSSTSSKVDADTAPQRWASRSFDTERTASHITKLFVFTPPSGG